MKVHALAILLLLQAPVEAETIPATIVTFDMPHGGCRLSVNGDGSGSLAYGALPALIKVKPSTFLPATLVNELKRVVVPRFDSELSGPSGSGSFGASEDRFWFSDKEFARVNFLKALANAEAPRQTEEAGAQLIEQACREL